MPWLAVLAFGRRRQPKDLAYDMAHGLIVHAGLDQFHCHHAETPWHEIVLDLVLAVDLGAQKFAAIRLKDAEQERKNGGLAYPVRCMNDVMDRISVGIDRF